MAAGSRHAWFGGARVAAWTIALLVHVQFMCVECRGGASAGTSKRTFSLLYANQPLKLRGGGNAISCWAQRRRGAAACDEDDDDVVDAGTGPVKIKLVLHYIGDDKMTGYIPAVVGDGETLGDWDWNKAVRMRQSSGGRWTAVVSFPRENREYEFKYVLLGEGGQDGMWEDGLNRAISVTDSGQAEISHSAQLPHHFRNALNVAPVLIDVTFKAHASLPSSNSRLAIVGDHSLLGSWNASKALVLKETGEKDRQNRTVWKGMCAMPLSLLSEYKHIMIEGNAQGGRRARMKPCKVLWEGGENHHLSVSAAGHVHFTPDSYEINLESFVEAEEGQDAEIYSAVTRPQD